MSIKLINGTCYETFGARSSTVVVLIHGLGLNKSMWRYQVSFLKGHYSVLTYDLFGHGRSKISEEEPSLSIFTEQLKAMLSDMKISNAVLIGFSLGGMIARHFAQTYPESVVAIIILNSPHKRTLLAKEAVQKRYKQVSQYGPASTVEDAIKRWFTRGFEKHNKEKVQLIREWVLSNDKDVYSKNYKVLVDGVEEVTDKKGRIKCPTLVIAADEDYGNGPEMAKMIAEEISGSKLVVVRGLRHMALFEKPKEINKHLNSFLELVLFGE